MPNACLKKANPATESYTSGFRTPSVDLHVRFRSFSIKPVESTRSSSIGFSFSAFFGESVETEMTQERDQKRHQKRDFETRTRILVIYCLIADGVRLLVNRWFSSRQLGFVDAHKNLHVVAQ